MVRLAGMYLREVTTYAMFRSQSIKVLRPISLRKARPDSPHGVQSDFPYDLRTTDRYGVRSLGSDREYGACLIHYLIRDAVRRREYSNCISLTSPRVRLLCLPFYNRVMFRLGSLRCGPERFVSLPRRLKHMYHIKGYRPVLHTSAR